MNCPVTKYTTKNCKNLLFPRQGFYNIVHHQFRNPEEILAIMLLIFFCVFYRTCRSKSFDGKDSEKKKKREKSFDIEIQQLEEQGQLQIRSLLQSTKNDVVKQIPSNLFNVSRYLLTTLWILIGKRHPKIKAQSLQKIRIWAFGLLIHEISFILVGSKTEIDFPKK